MKRNILFFSVLAMLSAGILSVFAKTDVTEGDWDDDDTPSVNVKFLNVPTASFSELKLHLTSDDKSASILWTTDPSATPQQSGKWTKYSAPLSLTEDCTVRFCATLENGVFSKVGSYKFVYSDHQVAAPTISSDAGGKVLTFACSTPGATLRYTDDGSEPTEKSTVYSAPVNVSSYMYRVKAYANGYFPSETVTYLASVTETAVTVPTAKFENLSLVLECQVSGAAIMYTLDSSATADDASAWREYTAPLFLTEDCVVRFFGRKDGMTDSDIDSFNFVYSNYQAADPTIERNNLGTHIVMQSITPNAQIRYTTDGTEPTASSALYVTPVLIEGNLTYTAKTFAPGLFASKSNRYVVTHLSVPMPHATFARKHFVLSSPDPWAEIWYTTDPTATPEDMSRWTRYSDPVALTENCVLRYFARRANFNDSDMGSTTFVYADYQNVAPKVNRNSQGTHIVMETATQTPSIGLIPDDGSDPIFFGAQIRYTTDGSDPTEKSQLYESPVRIQLGTVYKARVFDENYFDSEVTEYSIGNSSTPVPEVVYHDFKLHLTCLDEDASIWYTTDPTATLDNLDDWQLYTAPIVPEEDCIYRFFAGDDDDNASDIQSYVFQRADHTVVAPKIETTYDGLYVVMSTTTPDADIRFTTDGTEPTADSMLYVEPIEIPCNMTILAKAFAEDMYDSEISELIINSMSVPVAYANVENKHLVLTCADPLATIWYTTDMEGNPEDMEKWSRYDQPIILSEDASFHFFTRRDNFNDSDIETFVFVKANYQVASPVISRSEDGAYLVMECLTEGAEIRFTTDGSDPDLNSELYVGALSVAGNVQYRVRAFADGLFDSEITEYIISGATVEDPVAEFKDLVLHISDNDAEAQIWYAIENGTEVSQVPDTDITWLLYSAPLELTEDCIVRYFASRPAFNSSFIQSFQFVYKDYQVKTPVIFNNLALGIAEISCEDSEAELRYTLDGTDPDQTSTLYVGSVPIVAGRNLIRVRGFADGKFPSEIAELDYNHIETGINEIEVELQKGRIYDLNGLPVKEIKTSGIYIVNGEKRLIEVR